MPPAHEGVLGSRSEWFSIEISSCCCHIALTESRERESLSKGVPSGRIGKNVKNTCVFATSWPKTVKNTAPHAHFPLSPYPRNAPNQRYNLPSQMLKSNQNINVFDNLAHPAIRSPQICSDLLGFPKI